MSIVVSLPDALRSIELLRSNASARARLREASSTLGLEAAPLVGAEFGLDFAVEELRQAFAIDWTMGAFHDRHRATASRRVEPDGQ